MKEQDLITRKQAAEVMGVSLQMLDIYKGRGYIKSVPTTNSRTYYKREDIEAYKKIRAERKAKLKAGCFIDIQHIL